MKTRLTLAVLILFGLACGGGGSSDDDDTAATSTNTDTGASGGSDSGDPDANDPDANDPDSGDPDTNDPDEPSRVLTLLEDPCLGAGTPYGLLFRSNSEGFVGCGSGQGLWRTTDSGDVFTRAHPSGDLHVFSLSLDAWERVLVCGRDYEGGKGMVFLEDGSSWKRLLKYGTDPDAPQEAAISNCGAAVGLSDGRMLVASLTVGDLLWSTDSGESWSPEERYWEDANLSGGYSYYYMLSMRALADDTIIGAGSQITEPPVLFGPSTDPQGGWMNFHAHIVNPDIIGEVWAMDTPDDGQTWFVGGRDQGATSRASGYLSRSADGGATWAHLPLGEQIDVLHDIAFDGNNGVAVGHRYPLSNGGFVLITTDGGASWRELGEDVPLLQSADVVGDTFWIAGDAFLARGHFSEIDR